MIAASWVELNHRFRRWLDEVANRRTSAEIGVMPEVALEEERPFLLAVRPPGYRIEQGKARKTQ